MWVGACGVRSGGGRRARGDGGWCGEVRGRERRERGRRTDFGVLGGEGPEVALVEDGVLGRRNGGRRQERRESNGGGPGAPVPQKEEGGGEEGGSPRQKLDRPRLEELLKNWNLRRGAAWGEGKWVAGIVAGKQRTGALARGGPSPARRGRRVGACAEPRRARCQPARGGRSAPSGRGKRVCRREMR